MKTIGATCACLAATLLSFLQCAAGQTIKPDDTHDSTPFEDFQLWKEESPNRQWFAAIRRTPEESYIWKEDLDGCRLVLFPVESDQSLGDERFRFDLGGRVPAKAQWTPDSKFLVFTTVSSAGHSPWNFKTYFLDVAAKRLIEFSDAKRSVVSPDFTFTAPHSVHLRLGTMDESKPETLDIQSVFDETHAEQLGDDKSATRSESKPEGGDKPQPESGAHPR